jgi:hypothetical protein
VDVGIVKIDDDADEEIENFKSEAKPQSLSSIQVYQSSEKVYEIKASQNNCWKTLEKYGVSVLADEE